jgi:protein involved in temperature-dependent protein secretion
VSEIEDVRAQLKALEKEEKLKQALEDAAAAHREDPTEANLRKHDKAAVALNDHWSNTRASGGITVGGDAFKTGE